MILIAHRGNINGPSHTDENSPEYITRALGIGFDVEIDVWSIENRWYLGHDEPTYLVNSNFLQNQNLWCHAKNINALYGMMELNIPNYFWHETDKFTLTSSGYIWTYPGNVITSKSILVIVDDSINHNENIYGVCSDYVSKLRR